MKYLISSILTNCIRIKTHDINQPFKSLFVQLQIFLENGQYSVTYNK